VRSLTPVVVAHHGARPDSEQYQVLPGVQDTLKARPASTTRRMSSPRQGPTAWSDPSTTPMAPRSAFQW